MLVSDTGFERGHPIIMEHPSGVVINLLGPADDGSDANVLMDVEAKHTGYTHMALRVGDLAATQAWAAERDIAITGRFAFKGLRALFIRDPDRNVIEFDEYEGQEPRTRLGTDEAAAAYRQHP